MIAGWLSDLDQLAQHGGCDVIKGTKWVANLWLTLVGKQGTDEPFKGWIDYGKDETKYKPGTDWKGDLVKQGSDEESSEEKKGETEQKKSEIKDEEKTKEEKEKAIKEAKESGDGSYDVKLEL